MAKFFSKHIDLLGFSISFLCGIHCLLIPVLLALGVFNADSLFSHGLIEYIVIPASVIIASWALYKAYNKHKNSVPLITAIGGFSIILLSYLLNNDLFHYLIGAGGFLIAFSHFYNWRLLHKKVKA